MTSNQIGIAPHGVLDIVQEHGREWAICKKCGAEYAIHGADAELVGDGDGFCEEEALNEDSGSEDES